MHETARRLLAVGLAKGETSFAGIARALGASDQSATNWKKRGVPREIMIRAAALYGVDAAWLANDAKGKAPECIASREYTTPLALTAMYQVNEKRGEYFLSDDEKLIIDGYRIADDGLRRGMLLLATGALDHFGKRRANHNAPAGPCA